MEKRDPYAASNAATRKAQESLDQIQRDKSAVTRQGGTGDDVNRANIEKAKDWKTPRSPR